MKVSRAYGNLEVYSPDNVLMFLCNEDKVKSYEKKGLITHVDGNKYQFLFEPRGRGHGERNQELLVARKNECVCCGNDELDDLTRHHIVPTRFRKHMPMHLKGNNHRYVVFLCRDCHNEYGIYENAFNDDIARDLGVPTLVECLAMAVQDRRIIAGYANTLLFVDGIPESRREEIKILFREEAGLEPTDDNLITAFRKRYEPTDDAYNFGKLVVDKTKNLYEFQQMWLEHFYEHMKPLFLPHDLRILLGQQ